MAEGRGEVCFVLSLFLLLFSSACFPAPKFALWTYNPTPPGTWDEALAPLKIAVMPFQEGRETTTPNIGKGFLAIFPLVPHQTIVGQWTDVDRAKPVFSPGATFVPPVVPYDFRDVAGFGLFEEISTSSLFAAVHWDPAFQDDYDAVVWARLSATRLETTMLTWGLGLAGPLASYFGAPLVRLRFTCGYELGVRDRKAELLASDQVSAASTMKLTIYDSYRSFYAAFHSWLKLMPETCGDAHRQVREKLVPILKKRAEARGPDVAAVRKQEYHEALDPDLARFRAFLAEAPPGPKQKAAQATYERKKGILEALRLLEEKLAKEDQPKHKDEYIQIIQENRRTQEDVVEEMMSPFGALLRSPGGQPPPGGPPFWREWTRPTLAENAKKLYEQEVLAGPLLDSCPECPALLGKDVSLFSGLSGSRSLLRGKWLMVYKDNTPPYEDVAGNTEARK